MTGPEHYREAERLLAIEAGIPASNDETSPAALQTIAEAQAHATLALAAATALAGQGEGNRLFSDDRAAWIRAASEVPGAAERRREADAAELAEFAKEQRS